MLLLHIVSYIYANSSAPLGTTDLWDYVLSIIIYGEFYANLFHSYSGYTYERK